MKLIEICTRRRMAIVTSPRGLLASICVCSLGVGGCGYGINSTTPAPTDVVAPVILQQPSNLSIPMGLAGTYVVEASGDFAQYQWTKNGVAIPGATGSTYVTPPTTFLDTGATFAVTVSNSAGAATSNAASLTVTARAPAAGDLRFQQVDAASTVNGYGSGESGISAMLTDRIARDFTASIGTPFWVGGTGACTVALPPNVSHCAWSYQTFPLPSLLSGLGLIAGYASDAYANFQYDLADPNWPNIGSGVTPAVAGAVVTALDLEPAAEYFAVSWAQAPSDPQSSFSLVENTVSPSALQAAASQEGANGRVITAVSNQSGEITYLSYGWSADPSTVYELTVSTAAPASAPAAAAEMAAQGYILTASGLADAAGDVVLVGTRVQGDTRPRPFIAAQTSNVQTMRLQGYATVAVIVDSTQSDPYTYLGER